MKLRHLPALGRYLGPHWVAQRAIYSIKTKSGLLERKLPAVPWEAQPLEGFLSDRSIASPNVYFNYRSEKAPPFFFSATQRYKFNRIFKQWDHDQQLNPIVIANRLEKGKFRYFEGSEAELGMPPDWHFNPLTGQRAPTDAHWSRIGDFDSGDVKIFWEPSRFSFAFTLVRAYWRTGDERYPELFWRLVESWRKANPPQVGVNWKCGQEASFRLMAWCFALYGFADSLTTTPERVTTLAAMAAVIGSRIEANIDYALSQANNHGISEAVGLWTVGTVFPEFKRSSHWRNLGREVLERDARRLIYEDGSFSQHSTNYQRVMLHDYVWALRIGELVGQPFSAELYDRVRRSGELLFQMQDDRTGEVPCYGHDDGALVLPLNNCCYRDFRPIVGITRYLTDKTRQFDHGPWDEDLLWLFGAESLDSSPAVAVRKDLHANAGGYYTLRSPEGFVFTRCGSFRHRPSHADMLHVDLWWRGQNIALDPGTHSYNAPGLWQNPFAETQCHNTVSVDGQSQMELASRFLWLPWLSGSLTRQIRSDFGLLSYFEGGHDGYERLDHPAHHRRAVVQIGDTWIVIDSLTSRSEHDYRLHWLLNDFPYRWQSEDAHLIFQTPSGNYHILVSSNCSGTQSDLIRADEGSTRGWRAPYYGVRNPALSLAVTARADTLQFVTYFGPDAPEVTITPAQICARTASWQARIGMVNGQTIVNSISVAGTVEDRLVIN